MFGRSNGAAPEGRAGFVCWVINNEGRWLDFFELTWVRWDPQLVKKWYSISYVNALTHTMVVALFLLRLNPNCLRRTFCEFERMLEF